MTKWLSFCFQTKWLWDRVPLHSPTFNHKIYQKQCDYLRYYVSIDIKAKTTLERYMYISKRPLVSVELGIFEERQIPQPLLKFNIFKSYMFSEGVSVSKVVYVTVFPDFFFY